MNADFKKYIQNARKAGRTIQYRNRVNTSNRWTDINSGGALYFSDRYDYRVKPMSAHCYDEQVVAAWKNGATVQFRMGEGSTWRDAVTPTFAACLEWRVKPDVTITPADAKAMTTDEVERQYYLGAKVQFKGPLSGDWIDTDRPRFDANIEWRVAPGHDARPPTPLKTCAPIEWELIWSLNGQVAKLRGELAREKEKVDALQRAIASRAVDNANIESLRYVAASLAETLDSTSDALKRLGKGA